MRKKLICMMLAGAMVVGMTVSAFADQEEDIRNQKAAAEAQLGDTYSSLDALAAKQKELQDQISAVNADLVDLLVQISQAEQDIESTKGLISTTEGQIDYTQESLEAENDKKDQQYRDMVNRIQYIYEKGGTAGWTTILLKADSLANFLNRAEYTTQLENADRNALNAYEATIAQIEQTEAELQVQKTMLEEQQRSLEAQEAMLEEQKANLETELANKQAQDADYANQIEEAKAQARAIESLIAQQQAELERIEAEKEAARRAAEEEAARQEAARKAAEEEAARQAAISGAGSSSGSSGTVSGGSSGDQIVAYACQFIGNPYVWGGNSLTHGIDCSHFVWQVLRNCGVYSGGYMTSGYWATAGRPVGSLAEAQAGDVIVYSGHVAIYDGNGMIVEAKGAAWGITHDRRADCRGIVAIRRFT
ncbi:MAG: NlpC/P60 family protein [Lachnospiraceae bacterium]|nr:NlpC/P60 family protein [Lachnospiraceae bacterium]